MAKVLSTKVQNEMLDAMVGDARSTTRSEGWCAVSPPDEPADTNGADQIKRMLLGLGTPFLGSTTREPPTLRVIYSDGAPPLRYEHDGDSGMNLYNVTGETFVLNGDFVSFGTGVQLAIPPGYEGQIRPRSSATRDGWLVPIGTIDASYRGVVRVQARNVSGTRLKLSRLHSIAQLVIAPVACVAVVDSATLDETTRGDGGFGSTG